MRKKTNTLYGIAIITVITSCVWFYYGYVYPRLPEPLEIPTSYMTDNYHSIDSMAICEGDVDEIGCFYYMFPQAYYIGYEMIMANRYKDADSHYYFLEDLLFISSGENKIYSFYQFNAKLDHLNDTLRVIVLRHLSHCDSFYRKIGEDTIRLGKYVSLYDSIKKQEQKTKKGGDGE